MNTNDAGSITADFKIDRGDLFRAYLEVAKWRLRIGACLILLLAIGDCYFFVLIGEREILLQTFPLFVGVPLVALTGQVLRLRASSGKYVSGLTQSQRQLHYVFPASGDGYNVTFGESFTHTAWNDVRQVVEKSRFFLIYRNRFEIGLLPKRAFDPNDIPTFRRILRSTLGERAKLQQTTSLLY
ncbi:MAG TPA: YcxB family protein [Pyrinomonadaceae bacterium]|nr:YcxB family protein [Pyrinomonadaceae bacterium]